MKLEPVYIGSGRVQSAIDLSFHEHAEVMGTIERVVPFPFGNNDCLRSDRDGRKQVSDFQVLDAEYDRQVPSLESHVRPEC